MVKERGKVGESIILSWEIIKEKIELIIKEKMLEVGGWCNSIRV